MFKQMVFLGEQRGKGGSQVAEEGETGGGGGGPLLMCATSNQPLRKEVNCASP